MKYYYIILFSFLLHSSHAISQDYMDQIIDKACSCVDDDLIKISNLQQRNLKIGLCWIDAAMPYKKQLKTDYNINLDNINRANGEKLGKVIGTKMASVCPDKLMRITQEQLPTDSDMEINIETAFRGSVTKIENELFVVFSIKDELTGKVYKLLWLNHVKSQFDLMSDYESLINQLVDCSYKIQEFFDPKINEYRRFNVLTEIKIVE